MMMMMMMMISVTYDDDGRRRGYAVDSAEQSSCTNCRHDARIHPPPRASRIRRSVDRLPQIAQTDADRSPVQTPGHSVCMDIAHDLLPITVCYDQSLVVFKLLLLNIRH